MAPLIEAYGRIRFDKAAARRDIQAIGNDPGNATTGRRVGSALGSGTRQGLSPHLSALKASFAGTFAALGVIKGIRVFGGFIADARESARFTRITEAAIKSTGGAAHITAGQIDSLAQALSNKTAIDDEVVQSGENLLLTFTGIRNEVGKGNDIFNRASAAVLDMTASLNHGQVTTEGVKASSIQLGKALNDPIKGVTALRKVGVSFTQQQTDQIKTLVASGHTLEAQKIILGEVGKEFGGAATAAADPMARLRTIAANLGESIGTLVLPAINRFASWLTDRVVPAVQGFMAGLSGKGPVAGFTGMLNTLGLGLRALVLAFKEGDITSDGFVGAMEHVGVVLRSVWNGIMALVAAFREGDVTSDGFVGVMERIGVALRGVFDYIRTTVVPLIARFLAGMRDGTGVGGLFAASLLNIAGAAGNLIGFFTRHTTLLKSLAVAIGAVVVVTRLHTAAMAVQAGGGIVSFLATYLRTVKLVQGATKVWTAFQWLLNIAMSANPIGLVIVAVAGLVAGFVIAYKTSATFRAVVSGAFHAVLAAAQGTVRWIRTNWPLLLAILTGPVGAAVIVISRHFGTIRHVASALVSAMGGYFVGVWNSIQRSFLGMISSILTGFSRMLGAAAKMPFGLGHPFAVAKKSIDAANDSVIALRNSIGRTKGKTVGVVANLTITGTGIAKVALSSSGGKIFQADGGIVKAYASGGVENHVAQIARGGTIRVWAEKETKGEAYIPFAPEKRQRSTQILGTVAKNFGYRLEKYADGGITYPMSARGTAGIPRIVDQITTKWANYTGRKFAAALEKAMTGLTGGPINPGLAGALAWARSQVGKPYVWGGVGPGGWDCSGFMGSIINVIKGRSPYSRLFATGSMPAGGLVEGLRSAFTVGWFVGNPGHTAGTLNGVNVESAGGVGVRVGSSARGATSSLFNRHAGLAGYAQGGIFPGDPPFDLFSPRGRTYVGNDVRRRVLELLDNARVFDAGGYLPPHSATLAINRTRQWEPVGANAAPMHITINMPPGSDGADVVHAIQKYEGRNGKGWRT